MSNPLEKGSRILFGWDPTPGVVAVEASDDSVTVFRRVGTQVVTETRSFRRWFLTTEKHSFVEAEWTELEGNGLRFLAEFPDRNSFQRARMWLKEARPPHIAFPSSAKQFLMRSGVTFFKEMGFNDVHRLQIDIETMDIKPDKPESRVLLVAISDNRGFETVVEGDEIELLCEVVRVIRERDPDVIEGHNVLGFDLPYLAARAKRHGVSLAIGRDGSELAFGLQQICPIGYMSKPFVPVHIHGRQVVDTLLGSQRYDISRGMFHSYSLKSVAETLGLAEAERELIPHDQIGREWQRNPDRVRTYAIQDVRETRAIAEIVLPPEFYTTQMVPEPYSLAATTGNGEKINALLLREYLRRGCAIPVPDEPRPLPGGYTEVKTTGVVYQIVKCDVESLYPSIMLSRGIKPQCDVLDVFLPALEELTRRRLAAKRQAKEVTGSAQAYWEGLQSAFKILINSFYGYLAGPFNFNDFDAAAQITAAGRETVKQIVAELERAGSLVIEVDTDGVYFRPPDYVRDEDAEVAYVDNIASKLPEGIRLTHDGRYKAMISLKMKNYVLATYDGKLIFKGSALRSRADEPFGVDFIRKASELLISGQKPELGRLYLETARRIRNRELSLAEFCRRERITNKTFASTSRKRLAEAAREARVGDFVLVYQRADGSIALASDYNNDEDTEYLLGKLYKFASRLREAVGPDFDALIPKPSSTLRAEAAGQQTLELFE